MAEPLTSSDIIRERMGFGVSPLAAPETRRAYVEAGLSPLGTQERERFARGGGISPMASTAEKEAWVAAEVQAGRRPETDLPKAYGGLGERPTATTRRGYRMQQEWDKQREMMIQERDLARKQEVEAKEWEMRERDQFLQENDFYYNRGLKEAEQKLQAQKLSEATTIINGLNQLDPKDSEYQQKRSKIFGDNPLGAADPNVQKVATEYSAVNEIYGNAMKEQATGIKEAQEKYAADMQRLMESGVTEAELPQYINPKSPVGLPMFDPLKVAARVGGTKAQEKAEAKTTKEETPKEKIGLDLQQAYGELNSALMSGKAQSDGVEAEQAKIAGLRARYEAATGEAAPEVLPKLKTREEYDRLPAGTPYIGKDGKKRIKQ